MPRRREVPKREVIPDPKYHDKKVTKFMNVVMLDGKKAVAERIVYGAFDVVQSRTREDPLQIFHRALENCKPSFELRCEDFLTLLLIKVFSLIIQLSLRSPRLWALIRQWIHWKS